MNRLAIASAVALSVALASLVTAPAGAVPHIYKHDQFPTDFATALAQMNGMQLATQPGFVQGEAFGQIFRPAPGAYPLEITGFDLILAAAPLDPSLMANAQIEVYNTDSTGPNPGNQPIFVAGTDSIFNPNTQDLGMPLQGGIGYSITFDLEDEQNHPPLIFDGNIFLVIRFSASPTETTSNAWGVIECIYWPDIGGCGCQGVGTIQDQVTTPYANVMHAVTPLGSCSGNKTWMWAEDAGVTGDFVMRLRAEVANAPCVADCDGKSCGQDGCGGSCGTCTGGLQCYQDQCVSCIPDCISKQCGDDGCGGTCGTCAGGYVCEAGGCEVPCVADCEGRVCGDDGCGGTCGSCSAPDTCNDAGKCIAPCAPSCAAEGACGDDGCGGSCGTCAVGDHCDAGLCVPDCVADCADKSCGGDGCGGSCGTCDDGDTCVDGGCVTPCAPYCDDRECGDDGCGGVCGSCDTDEVCVSGQCDPICTPDCAGKACGDDGCGGTCGGCTGDDSCDAAGLCVAPPAELVIDDISPDFGLAGQATPISITGGGFLDGATVLIGGRTLETTTFVSSQVLTGSVPADLNAGSYTVIVTNPGGASATLSDAFEVRAATSGKKDSGCSGGDPGATWLLAALAALALLTTRRRRA